MCELYLFKVIIRTVLFNFHYSNAFVSPCHNAIVTVIILKNCITFSLFLEVVCINLFNIPAILEHLFEMCVFSSLDLCQELILGNIFFPLVLCLCYLY